ncbi:hypothetical protein [Streptomyces diastatochromogenes]|uniref:hypothetical protein n=1 Tax=Streptomyces diastatochromogenes TaxID=42236 RepID=UPI00369F95B5
MSCVHERPPPPHPAGPVPACSCTRGAIEPVGTGEPAGSAGRFGPTHTLVLLIAVLGLGSALFLAGTPLNTVFALLGGLGAIGAATLTAAGGGRLMMAFVEAAVRFDAGK